MISQLSIDHPFPPIDPNIDASVEFFTIYKLSYDEAILFESKLNFEGKRERGSCIFMIKVIYFLEEMSILLFFCSG